MAGKEGAPVTRVHSGPDEAAGLGRSEVRTAEHPLSMARPLLLVIALWQFMERGRYPEVAVSCVFQLWRAQAARPRWLDHSTDLSERDAEDQAPVVLDSRTSAASFACLEQLGVLPPPVAGWVPRDGEDGGSNKGLARWFCNVQTSEWIYNSGDEMYFHLPSSSLWERRFMECQDPCASPHTYCRVDAVHLQALSHFAQSVDSAWVPVAWKSWARYTRKRRRGQRSPRGPKAPGTPQRGLLLSPSTSKRLSRAGSTTSTPASPIGGFDAKDGTASPTSKGVWKAGSVASMDASGSSKGIQNRVSRAGSTTSGMSRGNPTRSPSDEKRSQKGGASGGKVELPAAACAGGTGDAGDTGGGDAGAGAASCATRTASVADAEDAAEVESETEVAALVLPMTMTGSAESRTPGCCLFLPRRGGGKAGRVEYGDARYAKKQSMESLASTTSTQASSKKSAAVGSGGQVLRANSTSSMFHKANSSLFLKGKSTASLAAGSEATEGKAEWAPPEGQNVFRPGSDNCERHMQRLELFLADVRKSPQRLVTHVEKRRAEKTNLAFIVS